MKKSIYVIASLIMVALLFSCEKQEMTDNQIAPAGDEMSVKKSASVEDESTPISENGVTPYIIPGENRGGNRTCEEVAAYFDLPLDYFKCGEKKNYDDYETEDDFEAAFGDLNVVIDENHLISFSATNCIMIEGNYYKVGAVIVKGGNSANVYYYPDGTLQDAGLAAPDNENMVSNLTFCFVECKDLVLAIKSFYWFGEVGDNSTYTWARNSGELPTLPSGDLMFTSGWCYVLEISDFPFTGTLNMLRSFTNEIVGIVTMTGNEVTVDLNDGLTLDKTHYYLGSKEALNNNLVGGCPHYESSPWVIVKGVSNIHTFTID